MANTYSLDLESGSSQYASIAAGSLTGLGMTGDFTLECWVKLESAPDTDVQISLFGKWTGATNTSNYELRYRDASGTKELRVMFNDGGGLLTLEKAATLTPGTWYHIAVAFTESTGTAEFYVDSSSIGTATKGSAATLTDGGGDFIVGAGNTTPTRFYDGLIDEVRVWNDIRTSTEISDNYDTEISGASTGLQGYWKFNNDYLDETSNNNDLTASGSPVFSTDASFMDKSLDLELSSSQYASITDALQTGLDITGDISIEAWVKIEQLPSTAGTPFTIVSKYDTGSNQRAYALHIQNGNDKLYFDYTDDGTFTSHTTREISDAAIFTAGDVGSWVHIAITADVSAQDIKMYKNGSLVASTADSTDASAMYDSSAAFAIGKINISGSASWLYDGLIDEVRVWNDVRTGTEISDNYQTELDGDEAGLVGYWRLNNNYVDQSANGNLLTPTNAPVFSTDVPFTGVILKQISETFAISETIPKSITRSITETLNLSEIYSGTRAILKAISETIGLTEKIVKLLNGNSTFWTNGTKPSDSWTKDSKPSDTWTEDSKPSDSWVNDDK